MLMYGAILGDIIGSPYEFDRGEKTKEFELFAHAEDRTLDGGGHAQIPRGHQGSGGSRACHLPCTRGEQQRRKPQGVCVFM